MSKATATAAIPQRRARLEWLGRGSLLGRLLRRKIHAVSMLVLILLVAAALAAPLLAQYGPDQLDVPSRHQGPSLQHWVGTDQLGRDILSRLMYGTRVSLQVGVLAVGLSHGLGISLGLLAGFRGAIADELVMRLMDALFMIPALVLALAIAAVLGPSLTNVMLAIGVTGMAGPARLTRGQVLAVREFDHVLAARAVGVPGMRIALRHVLPNILAALIVSATLAVGRAILTEAALSFLGVGIQPPTPSWGSMLQLGYGFLEVNFIESFAPGMAIFITVLAINLLGDGLREVLDPRLRGLR